VELGESICILFVWCRKGNIASLKWADYGITQRNAMKVTVPCANSFVVLRHHVAGVAILPTALT
jgi:dTDP-4-dehydrorhamnose 3,5-epimerase-like enzyme